MKEKIRIAMIGCGRFARFFVPLFKAHPEVEKVWVCDLIEDRAKAFSEQFGVDIIDSFETALASDKVNAIAIFTQRDRHGPMVIKALKAGKHVYSAVPCTIDTDDIYEIAELVAKTRLTYSMGETGFYRAPTLFCRRETAKGTFGKFVYAEAQYNHDIRNMENSFHSSAGEDWKRYAGIPPFYYPTHSTSMILATMPGVYAKQVSALGYSAGAREDIYGGGKSNLYNNPFGNETMLMELSNGGIARVSENRCLGWGEPATYLTQYYGTDAGYEFSVAHHHFAKWDPERPGKVVMTDVTAELQPEDLTAEIRDNYSDAIQKIADGKGFDSTSPIQPTYRLPKEFTGLRNGHNGTHHFLVDDFCRAYATGKLSPTNIWQVARFSFPGLTAHKSALQHGKVLDVPDIGNPPEDWEVLNID